MKYTIEEANQYFAVNFNNAIWQLLDKEYRTEDDDNELINLAHASLLHWSKSPACKRVNLQRGEYMNAIAYINAKRKQPALYYANRCRAITEAYKAEMKDFDLAHSSLLMAMALRLNRNNQEADQYLQEAEKLGEAIQNPGDKKIFTGDLNAFLL